MTTTPLAPSDAERAQVSKPKRCTICNGRGYIPCDCWPCDCICDYGDEPCDECCGTGVEGGCDDY